MRNPIPRIYNFVRRLWVIRHIPLRVEFVVTDWCNLNCVGCTHYSPLAPQEFESLARLEKSMQRLSAVRDRRLQRAYLIGGETLLYPQLTEAMQLLAKYFPEQRRQVYTNGLMLPRMSEEFWETCRQCGIEIALTRYPVKFDYDAVEQLCRDKGVKCEVFDDRSLARRFFKFPLDPQKKQNGRLSHFKCYNRGCLSVVGNRLYPCSISGCVDHLNRAKGTDFRHEKGDWLDVDSITSLDQVIALRDNPVPFCSYCIYPVEVVAHTISKRQTSEWVREPKAANGKNLKKAE